MTKKSVCTLKDIASKLGVSVYTVSRALNAGEDVSEETRNLVQKTADEMGYVPNTGARNLRLGSSKTIALIYDDFTNPYYSLLIKNISTFLNDKGYSTTLFYDFDSISKLHSKLMERVLGSNVDGIISLIEITPSAAVLAQRKGVPFVQIGSKSSDPSIHCIYLDDEAGGKLATNYLIKKGKKRIGFVCSTIDHASCCKRLNAYKDCLAENGYPIDESLIVWLTDDDLSPEEALSNLLNKHVDAIIAFNDYSGYEIKKNLLKLNITDIEVVGFDNIAASFPLPMAIPSVAGNVTQVSKLATNTILKCIEGTQKGRLEYKFPVALNK